MPAFRYEVIDADGKTRKGVLNADNARAARTSLREQGLTAVALEQVAVARSHDDSLAQLWARLSGAHLSTVELALFTRQLASLLEAGLPLEQALTALLEQAERAYLRDVIASVRSHIMGGMPMSLALAEHPLDFSDIYRALVAAGEQSGQLAGVLSKLADYIESRNALVQKVRLAFTYPAIVTAVAFIIVVFLLTYVVPKIVSVFTETKQDLPALTVVMLAISAFVRHYGGLLLLTAAAGWMLWRRLLRNVQNRLRWHAYLLRSPLYGNIERSLNTARFASTLAITTGAGVPILRALDISRDTLSNLAMRHQVGVAVGAVREGAGLAAALAGRHLFAPMLIHMIRAGEATGALAAMLERAARTQQQDLERRALLMAGILEPALILVMGVVVLLIVLAVLMPIIEINQLVH